MQKCIDTGINGNGNGYGYGYGLVSRRDAKARRTANGNDNGKRIEPQRRGERRERIRQCRALMHEKLRHTAKTETVDILHSV